MAAAMQKATPSSSPSSCCNSKLAAGKCDHSPSPAILRRTPTNAGHSPETADQIAGQKSSNMMRPVETLPESPTANAAVSTKPKGIPMTLRPKTSHPLDPLSATEGKVAVATVRAAGAIPEERDSMRFIEVVLVELKKHVVAMADAYLFPPSQPALMPRIKGRPVIPTKLPPRLARLVVYNKRSNETTVWI